VSAQPLWNARGDVLRARFGEKVQKLAVDAGFTCPNLDGTKGRGGCTYCNNASFSPVAGLRRKLTIGEQLARGRDHYARRGRAARKFLAYFQPYTNTYAPAAALAAVYEEALAFPGVVGLAIGTRPDCVPQDVLLLLESYARRGIYVYLELGLETANDETQRRTNRCHTLADFEDAVRRADAVRRRGGTAGEEASPRGSPRGFEIGAHVILGLPGEGREDARRTAEALAPLPLDAVKLHHCYVCEGTALAADWRAGRFSPPGLAAYVEMAADFLERLPARVAIERICAACKPALLLAPEFRGGVTEVARRLEEEFGRRGTRQGALSCELAWRS
jgi:radical SAM protein (TIGR01212 family)